MSVRYALTEAPWKTSLLDGPLVRNQGRVGSTNERAFNRAEKALCQGTRVVKPLMFGVAPGVRIAGITSRPLQQSDLICMLAGFRRQLKNDQMTRPRLSQNERQG